MPLVRRLPIATVIAWALMLGALGLGCEANIVGFWAFDEAAGRLARDSSEQYNDGVLHNVTRCEGRSGGGLRFGGTDADSYVSIPGTEALELGGPFTIQLWWHKTAAGVQIFFRKGQDARRQNYYAYLEGDLHFSVTATTGQVYSVRAPAPADGWRHMAFVYDGTRLLICVDGEVTGSAEIGDRKLATAGSPLLLGTYAPGYRYCLGGVVDDLCVSNEGLTPAQMRAEMALARKLDARRATPTAFASARGGIVVAKGGKPGASIVVREDASPLQALPALELQRYVAKITGARLPLRYDSEDVEGSLILVGESRLTRQMGLPGAPLSGDEFVITARDGRLVLLGNDRLLKGDEANARAPGRCKQGTTNAVHAFLHDLCAVRWFMPGRLGEAVPRRETLEIAPIDVREQPARTFALGSGPWRNCSREWARRNLLGSSVFIHHSGGHLWYSLIPAKKYAGEHPEWFALGPDGARSSEGNHLCTSNPQLFTEALKNLRAIYDQGYEWVEIGQSDGYRRCRCEACEALDEYREDVGYWVEGKPADRVHLFHGELARQVGQSHPGRKALIIAYGPTGEPPHAFDRFADNVIVEFTHDPPELLQRWNAYHDRFTAYVYWFGTYHRMGFGPKASPEWLASELRRMRKAKAEGVYFCGGFDCWGTEGPAYYVASRLMRAPGQDEKALLAEFCTGLFGASARDMQGFFTEFYRAADTYREGPRTPTEVYLECFTQAGLKRCGELLDSAEKNAQDGRVRRRIGLFRDGYDYVRLTALAIRRAVEWREQKTEATRKALDAAVEQREGFIDAMLHRQALNGGDLPPVLDASRQAIVFGPREAYKRLLYPDVDQPSR